MKIQFKIIMLLLNIACFIETKFLICVNHIFLALGDLVRLEPLEQLSVQQLTILQMIQLIKTMKIKNLTKLLGSRLTLSKVVEPQKSDFHHYRPTPYLSHPFLQSVYNISEPLFPFKFKRQQIFFKDGGHISLDWLPPATQRKNPPILFVMHGLTGGSQMNYIKELMKPASEEGYCCVCLNSRGVNNEMTSPMPFTGIGFEELESALQQVSSYYPQSEIYMVGTSFGGNYLMRYLIQQQLSFNIKGLVALAPPIDVNKVVSDMGSVYQKFFVKRYIEETVCRHKFMQHWEDIGVVDMKKLKLSQNLMEFHTQFTAKILGYPSAKEVFAQHTIKKQEIKSLKIKTLMMLSKDDPIVSYNSMPFQSIASNDLITLHSTERGGHLCWFEGFKPKRWYPKPVLQFLNSLKA